MAADEARHGGTGGGGDGRGVQLKACWNPGGGRLQVCKQAIDVDIGPVLDDADRVLHLDCCRRPR